MNPAHPTPEDILSDWIGDTHERAETLDDKNSLWFGKSETTDAYLRATYLPLLEDLATGAPARALAAQGPRARLAAIIVLDQFSRNIFRDEARAFAQDDLARELCEAAIAGGEDLSLSETERLFLYLPLEHSEALADQVLSVEKFTELLHSARAPFRDMLESVLEYAYAHKAVIERFGRFPHRNGALGRTSTPEEEQWLAAGGGF